MTVAVSRITTAEAMLVRRPIPVTLGWTSGVPVVLFALLFAAFSRHAGTSTIVSATLAGALGGAASLIVHELGHVGAARRTAGVEPLKVSLIGLGAATYLSGTYRSGRDQIRVALGGPLASFLLAVPFTLAMALPLPAPDRFTVFLLALLNVGIGVISMLPINPLDGYKLLVGLVW